MERCLNVVSKRTLSSLGTSLMLAEFLESLMVSGTYGGALGRRRDLGSFAAVHPSELVSMLDCGMRPRSSALLWLSSEWCASVNIMSEMVQWTSR